MKTISDRTLGKLANLGTLAVGLVMGFAGGAIYRPQQQVRAQALPAPNTTIQEVSPGVTTGTFGANLILAHEIAADSLVVNGYDLMKMEQNVLNYLSTRPLAERADIENIINASRATTVYRIKPQPAAVPPPTVAPPVKK